MLTFDENTGDVLWNLQGSDKHTVFETLKVHDRGGKNQSLSGSLFRGAQFKGKDDFFVPQHPSILGNKAYSQNSERAPEREQRKFESVENKQKPAQPQGRRRIAGRTPSTKPTDLSMAEFIKAAKAKGWMK
jgi:hypothetical protein